MNYLDTLRPEAEKTIRPLADRVAKLTKSLASMRQRLETERGSAAASAERLVELKASASDYLVDGDGNAFASYKTKLKNAAANADAAAESVRLFESDLIPQAESALAKAKAAVQAALIDFVKASMPTCEARMAELIGAVLAERDSFMGAMDVIFDDYRGDFGGARRMYPDGQHLRTDPYKPSMMIATGLEESVYDPAAAPRRRGPFLAPTPAQAAQDGPQSTPTGAGETLDTQATDAQDAHTPPEPIETPLEDVQDGAGPTPTPALDAQDADPTIDFAPLDSAAATAAVDLDAERPQGPALAGQFEEYRPEDTVNAQDDTEAPPAADAATGG